MKVAVAQISCALGDFGANMKKVRDFVVRAKSSGVEVIVFPEMIDTGYSMPVIEKHARTWKEGAAHELANMAMENSMTIVAGISEREGGCIFNTQVLIDAQHEEMTKYRKMHLVTAAPLDERVCFSPGNAFVTHASGPPSLDSGLRLFKLGLSICYDLRFPEMARTLVVKHGANLIVNSSAWPVVRAEHLRILALARAVENQCYFVIANRVGTDDGVTLCGSSVIVDPSGKILATASSDREELIQGEVSIDVIADVRKKVPAFAHRRGELYNIP